MALMALTAMALAGTGSANAGGPRSVNDDPYGDMNWAGFYVGIQGGYGWGETEHTIVGDTSGEFDTNGGLIGATWGANWQRGNWVYGFESDFSFSDIEGTSPGSHFTEISNLSTARLRLGYAASTSLVYATGGLAYGTVHAGLRPGFFDIDVDKMRDGWVFGAGIEWAFAPRWSLKAEYLQVDLGDREHYRAPIFGDVDVHLTADIARIGVNYNLGPEFWGNMLGMR